MLVEPLDTHKAREHTHNGLLRKRVVALYKHCRPATLSAVILKFNRVPDVQQRPQRRQQHAPNKGRPPNREVTRRGGASCSGQRSGRNLHMSQETKQHQHRLRGKKKELKPEGSKGVKVDVTDTRRISPCSTTIPSLAPQAPICVTTTRTGTLIGQNISNNRSSTFTPPQRPEALSCRPKGFQKRKERTQRRY